MITISLQLPNELARRVMPLRDHLPEIIELGLRQVEASDSQAKQQVLDTLASTGIITLPRLTRRDKAHARRTPIKDGGPPASEMIIAERRGVL